MLLLILILFLLFRRRWYGYGPYLHYAPDGRRFFWNGYGWQPWYGYGYGYGWRPAYGYPYYRNPYWY